MNSNNLELHHNHNYYRFKTLVHAPLYTTDGKLYNRKKLAMSEQVLDPSRRTLQPFNFDR